MAKPRKKKPAKGGISATSVYKKEVESITNYCYQTVKFLGDAHHLPRCMGIQKLYTHLRGIKHELGMESFLKHLNLKRQWSMGISLFFRENEDKYYVIPVELVFEVENLEDLSIWISTLLRAGINEVFETNKELDKNKFCYYCYFFEPEVSPRLSEKVKGLGELFINLGDICQYEPFGEELPGIESDITTVDKAIENNGIFPKIKEKLFWEYDEETNKFVECE